MSRSTHEPRPRNRGKSKRPSVIAQCHTHLVAAACDQRAVVGEAVILERRSDGDIWIILPKHQGMVASHGWRIVANQANWIIKHGQALCAGGSVYIIPAEAWEQLQKAGV